MRKTRPIAFLLLALALAADAQAGARKGPIVRQVDRILIESDDPESLFRFFSAELQLPIAWPLTENQGYQSGALGTGNAIFEIYRYTRAKSGLPRKPLSARFAGLALEPVPLADALRELKAAGLAYGPAQSASSTLPDGKEGVAWTTVPLPSLSGTGLSIFLHEYGQAFLRADVRRKQLGNRLTLDRGGPLGIVSVQEISISTSNFAEDEAEWQRLLGSRASSGNWSVGAGPAIRLVEGSRNRIQKIIFRVRSLAQAGAFLKSRQLPGTEVEKEVLLNPSEIQGLRIGLVEQ